MKKKLQGTEPVKQEDNCCESFGIGVMVTIIVAGLIWGAVAIYNNYNTPQRNDIVFINDGSEYEGCLGHVDFDWNDGDVDIELNPNACSSVKDSHYRFQRTIRLPGSKVIIIKRP